jgi:GNAT superfamily N-acetyltransferase
LWKKLKLDGKPILGVPVLDFLRVEASQQAQLLELIGRSYAEFGQVPAAAEQNAVVEIASGEPLARAWLIQNKSELIGYCIVSLVFSVKQRGRGAVLDQIYITPELRTRQILRPVLEFVEYQAAQVGAIMLDIKFEFKDKPKSIAFKQMGFENGYSFMSKQLEPWPTYYRRSRE